MAAVQLDQPAALQSIVELEDALSGESEPVVTEDSKNEVVSETSVPMLPSLPADEVRGEASGPGTETSSPSDSAPASDTALSTPSDTSPATTTAPAAGQTAAPETIPTEDATPEPTEQTAVAEGPQLPESVRVGRQFAMVNRDGVELGAAKIEDIVRTPGCGVELILSISTSAEDGPGRWASISPDNFAEVRSSGATRDAARIGSDCAQSSSSKKTALSPGRDYEIVISFLIDDSAQQAMLRPGNTAGWTFDLPPLTRAALSTTAAPTTAVPTSAPPITTAPAESETAETSQTVGA